MEILHIFLVSVGSFIALFLLTKLMGDRQMSQLSMFDYIIGITIGSIAAEMATSLEDDFMKPLVAMVVYALLSIILAVVSNKSLKFRKFVEGEPILLFDNGKLYRNNLKKAKLDLNEFLTQCRNAGYFDLNNIQTALLETNGKISFLPKAKERPATPADLSLHPNQEKLVTNVVLDGNIMWENLKSTGNDESWLNKQLDLQGVEKISDIFLATCDCNNKLSIYSKIGEKEHTNFE
ncbi:MAG TPA: DUF421 domain-containing protein [Oscillospiraceae bacterium]|nr:DUF421 domain-containing protein [Oscillospiraceae bacterium]